VTYFCVAATTALMEETATSILQGEWSLSNLGDYSLQSRFIYDDA